MKTIQLLSVSIALAVIAEGCKGEPGPVGPAPLTRESNVAYHSYDDPADSLVVSFEGTRVDAFNTSGGTRLGLGKHVIYEFDWNINAQTSDGQEIDLISLSKSSEFNEVKYYIGNSLDIEMYCGSDLEPIGVTPF